MSSIGENSFERLIIFQSTSYVISVSPSMPGTTVPQSFSSVLTVAVAAGVTATVVLIVLTFLVVALVVCIQKAKQKKTSYITNTTTATLDNPTYDSNSNGNFSMYMLNDNVQNCKQILF